MLNPELQNYPLFFVNFISYVWNAFYLIRLSILSQIYLS